MNEIMSTVFGNVASEPRHLVTPQGAPLTSFRLASTPTRFDQGVQGYVEGSTTWLTVTCWRGLAFNAARSLRKGQPVIVHGALRVREWKDGERSGREVELDAVSLGHDLRRGRADFAKVLRPAGDRALLGGTPPSEPDDAAAPGAAANGAGAGDDGVAERGMSMSDADAPDPTGDDAPEREGGAAA
jgi:single-strand DNA-binding protein